MHLVLFLSTKIHSRLWIAIVVPVDLAGTLRSARVECVTEKGKIKEEGSRAYILLSTYLVNTIKETMPK